MINSTSTHAREAFLTLAMAGASLTGCGGGGGSGASPQQAGGDTPTVSTAAVGAPMYGQTLVLTLSGSNLDQGIAVSATGCDGVTIDTASSGPSAARYSCSVSAMGAGAFTIQRTNGGAVLALAAFTVPAPQVTMAFDNHAGVAGSIVVTLAPDKTPITVNNFLSYVHSGFYVGTLFHLVSPGFSVQGGGYVAPFDSVTQTLKPTGAPIPLEVGKGLSNTQWSISMARTKDPDTASATTQFFINLADNSVPLDPGITSGYAVFGSVTGGTADVMAIAGAPCVSIPLVLPSVYCVPTPNIVIWSAAQTR